MKRCCDIRLLLIVSLVVALSWIVLVSSLELGSVVAQVSGWSEPVNIANTPGDSRYQEIAADPWGNVHVVWSEDEDGQGWGKSIYYTMWNGESWTEPVDIFYAPPTAHIPAIAADRRGYVHVVWDANNTTSYSRARITDGPWSAVAWSSPRVLSTQTAFYTYWTDIAVDGEGNVHVVWIERSPDQNFEDLYYSCSLDSGETWSMPVNLSNTPGQSSYEEITVDDDGNPHVIWVELSENTGGGLGDVGVFHAWSADGGASWSEPERISRPEAEKGFTSGYPAIFADGQVVYAVWTEQRSAPSRYSIFTRRWVGGAWSAPMLVADDAGRMAGVGGFIVRARGAADSAGNLHLMWEAKDAEGTYVRYVFSNDKGWTWSSPVAISGAKPTVPWRADIAIGLGNQLHVVWFGSEEPSDIYYATFQAAAPVEPPLPFTEGVPVPSTVASTEPTHSDAVLVVMPTLTTIAGSLTDLDQGGEEMPGNSGAPLIAAIISAAGVVSVVILLQVWRRRL